LLRLRSSDALRPPPQVGTANLGPLRLRERRRTAPTSGWNARRQRRRPARPPAGVDKCVPCRLAAGSLSTQQFPAAGRIRWWNGTWKPCGKSRCVSPRPVPCRAYVRAMMLPAHFHAEPSAALAASRVTRTTWWWRWCRRARGRGSVAYVVYGRALKKRAWRVGVDDGAGAGVPHASRGVLASCGAVSLDMAWATRHRSRDGGAHVSGELASWAARCVLDAAGGYVRTGRQFRPGLALPPSVLFVFGSTPW
jgi:hypothetical protein